MAIVFQGFNGQLAAAPAVIYTCPAATKAAIVKILLQNQTGSNKAVLITITRGATTRAIIDKNIWAEDDIERDGLIVLEAGDALNGSCDSATSVDYDISVIEET